MRVNLNTPFAEKDEAKSLGARWDPARRVWYVLDVDDLTPFLRWIPKKEYRNSLNVVNVDDWDSSFYQENSLRSPMEKDSSSEDIVRVCGCDVLPWEDCQHTSDQ
jgi:hypothetical protein